MFTRIRRSTIVTALACALLALTMAGPAAARLIDEAPTSSLAGTTSKQNLRGPDAMDASRAYDIARAMERYYMTQGTTTAPGATAVDSQTRPAPAAPTSGTDGVDWPTTGIVLTVALLFAGGIVALTRRHRIPA